MKRHILLLLPLLSMLLFFGCRKATDVPKAQNQVNPITATILNGSPALKAPGDGTGCDLCFPFRVCVYFASGNNIGPVWVRIAVQGSVIDEEALDFSKGSCVSFNILEGTTFQIFITCNNGMVFGSQSITMDRGIIGANMTIP